jgi:hypothetical protein
MKISLRQAKRIAINALLLDDRAKLPKGKKELQREIKLAIS